MNSRTLMNDFINRSIGWERVFDSVANSNKSNFPPYNIVNIGDGGTELQMALAGYSKGDLSVTVKEKILTISSRGVDKTDDVDYTYKGVSKRAFTTKFSLGQHQKVEDVRMEDGMLYVNFVTILPEDEQERILTIN